MAAPGCATRAARPAVTHAFPLRHCHCQVDHGATHGFEDRDYMVHFTHPPPVQRVPGLKDQEWRMLDADTWSDANTWNSPVITCGCIQMHPHAWHAASSMTPDMPSRCCCTVQTPAWWQDQACPGVHKVQARHWHSPHLGLSSEGTLLCSRSTSITLLMSQQSSRCMWNPKPNPLSQRQVRWQAPRNHPAAQAAAGGKRWCAGMPLLLPQPLHPGPPG